MGIQDHHAAYLAIKSMDEEATYHFFHRLHFVFVFQVREVCMQLVLVFFGRSKQAHFGSLSSAAV